MTDLALNILISGQDTSGSSVVKSLGSAIQGLSPLFGNLAPVINQAGTALKDFASGNVVGGIAIIGAGLVGVGAESVKMAGDFQKSMMTLVTSAGESASNLKMVSDGVLQLSTVTGVSTEQLAKGMYMIESSGLHGAAGLDALRAAAMGSKAENADLGVVTRALTTILTDYSSTGVTASQSMNALTATVASGKTTLQNLATAMGNVLPIASSLGISFPQVGGALAVMTNAGMSAQRASMNLANAIRSLAAPSGIAQKSMIAVGLSAQQLKDTLSHQGLAAALQLVEDHVGKKFPAGSVEAVTAFKNIMGGATGYNVALMVGGAHMKTYKADIDSISKAMNTGGNEIMGWSEVQGTFNVQMDRAKASFDALLIVLGTQFLPYLTQLASGVAQGVSAFANWLTQTQAITVAFHTVGLAISTAIGYIQGIAPIIITNLVQTWQQVQSTWGTTQTFFVGLWAGIVNAFTNAKTSIAAAIQSLVSWWNQWKDPIQVVGALLLTFFAPALIKVGIEAGIAGAKLAGQFIASLMQTGTQAVTSAVETAKLTLSLIQTGIQSGITAAQLTGKFIVSMIQSGIQSAAAAAQIAGKFVVSLVQTGMEA